MDNSQLNIGVIGATGYIGTPYRKEIRSCDNARVVALCARRRDLLEAAGKEDNATTLTNDWREVVDHPDVNLVIVATPDALHHEAVMACAAAGRHLLCEKPIGVNAQQARAMLEAYQSKPNLAHYVPFWVRYADGMKKAKEVYDAGTLGTIRGVVYRWHNPRPDGMPYTWRDDPNLSAAGSIADVGSHAYDTVRWILSSEAKRVLTHADTISPRSDAGEVNLEEALAIGGSARGTSAPQKQGGTADYASIAWEFTNGAVGALILSHAPYFRKGIAPELELHGTKASLSVDRVSGNVTLVESGGSPEIIATLPDLGNINRFEAYVFPAIRSVIAGVSDNTHPDLDDGWRVQLFTDAAVASANTGHWVNVN